MVFLHHLSLLTGAKLRVAKQTFACSATTCALRVSEFRTVFSVMGGQWCKISPLASHAPPVGSGRNKTAKPPARVMGQRRQVAGPPRRTHHVSDRVRSNALNQLSMSKSAASSPRPSAARRRHSYTQRSHNLSNRSLRVNNWRQEFSRSGVLTAALLAITNSRTLSCAAASRPKFFCAAHKMASRSRAPVVLFAAVIAPC